jgi:flagellar hook protein FlgE
MMRSLFTGISGLKAHQLKMDVISNNIANVNTVGYKKSRITFEDLFSQTLKYAAAPQDHRGGVNPMQVGSGVTSASIDQIFTQGSFENTGKNSDVAIDGEGFFIVDDDKGKHYTRVGNFNIDSQGYFVHTATGGKVMGWQAKKDPTTGEAYIDTNTSPGYINFIPGEKLPAKASTYMEYRSNLDKTAAGRSFPEESTLEYGDPTTGKKKLTIHYEKLDDTTWNFSIKDDQGNLIDLDPNNAGSVTTGQVTVWPDGKIKDVTVKENDANHTVVPLTNIVIWKDGNGDGIFNYTDANGDGVYDTGDTLLNGDTVQDANVDGTADTFQVVRTPSEPPKDNYWTFKDIDGKEQKLWIKYTKVDGSQFTSPTVAGAPAYDNTHSYYKWQVYDENNVLVDIDGSNGDGGSSQGDTSEDFGLVEFNKYGQIINFDAPAAGSGGPALGSGVNSFFYNNHTYNIDSTSRQMTITETGSNNYREIPIGSDSIEYQFKASTDDKLVFDEIPGAKHTTSLAVYDSLGESHELVMNFEKLSDNKWRYYASLSDDDSIVKDYLKKNPEAKAGTELTDKERNAIMDNIFRDPKYGNTRSGILVFNTLGRVDVDATRAANSAQAPAMTNTLRFQPLKANPMGVNLDFNGVTQYEYDFTTAARQQDGYPMGMLQTYTIDDNGTIRGIYSNGYKQPIGKIGLATFYNPMGLQKNGNTMWNPSANSGNPIITKPGTGRAGVMKPGVLEMSNVDLAQEFTDMIIAQRGFQANSKSITTSDQMLQELVNLKR